MLQLLQMIIVASENNEYTKCPTKKHCVFTNLIENKDDNSKEETLEDTKYSLKNYLKNKDKNDKEHEILYSQFK